MRYESVQKSIFHLHESDSRRKYVWLKWRALTYMYLPLFWSGMLWIFLAHACDPVPTSIDCWLTGRCSNAKTLVKHSKFRRVQKYLNLKIYKKSWQNLTKIHYTSFQTCLGIFQLSDKKCIQIIVSCQNLSKIHYTSFQTCLKISQLFEKKYIQIIHIVPKP